MGYNVSSLLGHAFAKKKQNDYIEMMLHHLLTIYLYTFSYMTNTLIGAVVAFIHNMADVIIAFSRITAETEYKNLCAASFTFNQVVWCYSRLIIFPYIIYVSTVDMEAYSRSPYVQPTFGCMMACLVVMHYYWFVLMLKILLNYA